MTQTSNNSFAGAMLTYTCEMQEKTFPWPNRRAGVLALELIHVQWRVPLIMDTTQITSLKQLR
jgi:hypothetical protein